MYQARHTVAALLILSSTQLLAADQPRSQWDFRERNNDGSRIKPTIGELHLTIHGPVKFASDDPRVLELDGNSKARHRIEAATDIANLNLPAKAISIEAWVRVDKPLEWGGIIGAIQDNGDYERGWLVGYRKSQFCFAISSESRRKLTYLSANIAFEHGAWYHVVGTYDGREQRIYVDGKLRGRSKHQSGPIAYPPTAPYTIGAYHDKNELHTMTGGIEQISVWDRALTEDEVANTFDRRKLELPQVVGVHPDVDDWPTYRRDNQRTGITEQQLKFPLKLAWTYRPKHGPSPAWPAPAKQDFWHRKPSLKPRVTYDRAFHLVSVGNNVYFGSSTDDQLRCLDATTGSVKWTFFAEGPIRLAPTIADDNVLFGSDDGHVYCLNSKDGSLRWKHRTNDADRRIAGNERIISASPVRSGVLVDGDVAYFCTGLFPSQGVYHAAVNVRTGELVDRRQVDVSAQGYMARRSGKLYVTTGRDPAGSFVAQLERRGKGVGQEVRKIPERFAYAFIGAGDTRFGGGDNEVAAFQVSDGRQIWDAKVDGKAWSMAVSQGRLLVGTDRGTIHCFQADAETAAVITEEDSSPFPYRDPQHQCQYESLAQQLLANTKIHRGYCLVVNSGDGELLYELAKRSELKIIGVEREGSKVHQSRIHLSASGLYGRVTVMQVADYASLPFGDYLFNLVIDNRSVSGSRTSTDSQLKRFIRPAGGVVVLGTDDDAVHRSKPIVGSGEWTHMYANAANTVCSSDEHVGGPLTLQWFGRPGPRRMIDRHHRTIAPLSKHGRLFIPGDNHIFAVDAYNGFALWESSVPQSRRIAAFRDSSYLALGDQFLFVAAANQCRGLDVQSGDTRRTWQVPKVTGIGDRDWGYLATADGKLFGTASHPQATRRDQSRQVAATETYWDFVPIVCSDFAFAFDLSKDTSAWSYRPKQGVIINPTISIGQGRMYFVETNNDAAKSTGRAKLQELLPDAALVAIATDTGRQVWRQPLTSAAQHNLYTSYAKGKLVLVGSRNVGTNKKTARLHYDVTAFDASTGKQVWTRVQEQGTKIGGDHGEQDHHPVIIGDRLYCEPYAYDLHTGEPLQGWGWEHKHRRGCGNISASATTMFFRQANPTMFDLASNQYAKVTRVSRPGCWINMIPAGGMLLIPEASSGCTCNFAIQTSMGFIPTRLIDKP